jgi:flagellar basal-body rod protein FlgB
MDVKASQFDLLAKMLDVISLRHKVLAQNIANVNTPTYHRKEVNFENAVAQKMGSLGANAVLVAQPTISETGGGAERADGNNVDIEAELGRVEKNALLHNAYTQILAAKIGMMRSAINGR